MNDGCSRRRTRSLISEDEYDSYRGPFDYIVPEDDEDNINYQSTSCPWPIENRNDAQRGNRSSSCSSVSDSNNDGSIEISYSPLEIKHFENARNHGAFSEASNISKRERRKSFNKIVKKISLDDKIGEFQSEEFLSTRNDNDLPQYMQRSRSLSIEAKCKSPLHKEPARRKKITHSNKIRRKLSSNGIDLLDLSMDLTLDEIHELQQRFYSSVNIPEETKLDEEEDNIFLPRVRSATMF